MHSFGVWWSYFSPWSGSFIENVPAGTINRIYQSPEVLTLDELNARPPRITATSRVPSGALQVSGTGPHGASYRVLAAANLALPASSWLVLTNGTLSGGVFTFTDAEATTPAQKFYRIATP